MLVLFDVGLVDPPQPAIAAVTATTTSDAITRRSQLEVPEAICSKTLRPREPSKTAAHHRVKLRPDRVYSPRITVWHTNVTRRAPTRLRALIGRRGTLAPSNSAKSARP